MTNGEMLEDIYVSVCLLAFAGAVTFTGIAQQLAMNTAHVLNVVSAVSTVFLSIATVALTGGLQ